MEKLLSNAEFITADTAGSPRVPVFRRSFTVTGKCVRAVLTITARGIYEARLNGRRIGDFVFAPGCTNYRTRLQVQEYDVTAQIGKENTLTILLGDGWYAGKIQCGTFSALGPRCIIASLLLTCDNGRTEEIVTDGSWEYTASPILDSDFYVGETYDANVVTDHWYPVLLCEGGRDTLIRQEGEPIRETGKLPAVGFFITPKGEKVIDFGQEITGYVEFRTVGKKGDRIVFDCAEVLDKDGNFYNENYRGAASQITCITDGNRENRYHPIFSFQGFRYIRLKEYPEETVYPADFTAITVGSDLRRTGYFRCSDPLVNRLYENIIWGQRDNFLDIPTDCPQRDERLGWTGDAQLFCRTAAYNFDVRRFFRKWLRDMASEQGENGAIPEIVPRFWGGNTESVYGWGDAAAVIPWEMYLAYGDKTMLEEEFGMIKKWVDFTRNKGITPEEWWTGRQYGDWLGLDACEGSYDGATDKHLMITAHFAHSVSLLIKAGKALSRDMSTYENLFRAVRETFIRRFTGEDGMLTCSTQTAYTVAIVFGLSPAPERYADHLAEMIRKNGNKLQTGFIGTAYILDALSEHGHADTAYDLLLQEEYPSWLYCVRRGATTMWEHWDGIKPDGSMWSPEMNSFNHYAYGAVASFLYGTAAGIRPAEEGPGYVKIRISPAVTDRMTYAEAAVETALGTVSSAWRKTEDGYTLTVTVPAGAEAEVTFGNEHTVVTGGTYTFTMPDGTADGNP